MKAYSLLHVKALEETPDSIRVKGFASTPTTDRVGDIVRPMGAKFRTPMPLLLYHDSKQPVGNVIFAKPDAKGIPFEAELPIVREPGVVQDRVNEAIHSLKYSLIGAVSIGFNPIDYAPMKEGGYDIKEWEWLELSLVPIPANPEARITGVKSFDAEIMAAIGRSRDRPALRATPTINRSPKGKTMNMQQLKEAREQAAARLEELRAKLADETATDDETDEVDDLVASVKALDRQIKMEGISAALSKATPVTQGRFAATAKAGDAEDKFQGQSFTRQVIAKSIATLRGVSPVAVAEARWGKSNPGLVRFIKANEVPGGGTDSGEWGSELVALDGRYTGDFIEFLNGMTVFSRLNLREVPANITVKGQDATATGYWVGQSKAIPNTSMSFSAVNLSPLKVGAIAVASMELLEDSSPAAEGLIRDGLAEALSRRIDQTFFSTTAASAGVSPAGILNGLTPITATGVDDAALRNDIALLLASFDNTVSGPIVLVTTRALARQIGLLWNALGTAQSFPGVTPEGGMLVGYRVIVGDNVPVGTIIAIAEREVYRIGDSGLRFSVSREAMIEQSSAPTGATDTPAAATQVFTSMYQEESAAIKVVRRINYAKRRTAAVAYISGADYGAPSS